MLTGLTVGAAVILSIIYAPFAVIVSVCAILALLAAVEYVVLLRRGAAAKGVSGFATGVGAIVGAVVVAAALGMLAAIAGWHGNLMLLYIVAIVKFSDVGGFAFGLTSSKLMKNGNHKLCPLISPNKSWEGLAGSIILSVVISCSFVTVTNFAIPKAVAMGIAAALLGTAGDLVESKFKRWVGVKDSSAMKITNGLGGFLDMFDSLLIAPAVLAAFI